MAKSIATNFYKRSGTLPDRIAGLRADRPCGRRAYGVGPSSNHFQTSAALANGQQVVNPGWQGTEYTARWKRGIIPPLRE